jgi:hypothetical protein
MFGGMSVWRKEVFPGATDPVRVKAPAGDEGIVIGAP